jgi:DNA-binding protein H-NS
MEKIEQLLVKLENKITSSIYRRLEGLDKLEEKFNSAKAEHQANPTEESKENLTEIENYLSDIKEDLIEDLEELVEKREASKNAPAPNVSTTEVIEPKEKETEKSGMSIFGIALGVVLLVGTAGAYNYFSKNK